MMARCVYEVYEVTCSKCKTKFQVLTEPQEIHAKTTGSADQYQTAGAKCPKCGSLAIFLGPVARPVEITGF